MRIIPSFGVAALSAALVLSMAPQAGAQQNGQGWFIPGQQHHQAAPRPAHRAATPAPVLPPPGSPAALPPPGTTAQEAPPQLQVPLPPVPSLPDLPKGTAPPTPVIGVLGVPDVMRASTAAQAVQKVINGRRQKLAEDAQKEQAVWRSMQQKLINDRSKLSAAQLRKREQELQDRVTSAQKKFRDRNQVIQEAAQYALAQIERTLIAVIRQVAESRGMNLVLHRQQVALNINAFDVTDQVTQQLNKVLPAVQIPPDGMTPAEFVKMQDKKDKNAKPEAAKPAPAAKTKSEPKK